MDCKSLQVSHFNTYLGVEKLMETLKSKDI